MSSVEDLRNVLFGVAEDTGRLVAALIQVQNDIDAVQAKVNHAVGGSHNDISQQAVASFGLARTDVEQVINSVNQASKHIETYVVQL